MAIVKVARLEVSKKPQRSATVGHCHVKYSNPDLDFGLEVQEKRDRPMGPQRMRSLRMKQESQWNISHDDSTIFETCRPRSDVLKGAIAEADFAADLAQVITGSGNAEYLDPPVSSLSPIPHGDSRTYWPTCAGG